MNPATNELVRFEAVDPASGRMSAVWIDTSRVDTVIADPDGSTIIGYLDPEQESEKIATALDETAFRINLARCGRAVEAVKRSWRRVPKSLDPAFECGDPHGELTGKLSDVLVEAGLEPLSAEKLAKTLMDGVHTIQHLEAEGADVTVQLVDLGKERPKGPILS